MFNFKKPLAEGDCVLMTNSISTHYLQIGEVIEIEYYPNTDAVKLYRIQFEDTITEYGWNTRDDLKVLVFEK